MLPVEEDSGPRRTCGRRLALFQDDTRQGGIHEETDRFDDHHAGAGAAPVAGCGAPTPAVQQAPVVQQAPQATAAPAAARGGRPGCVRRRTGPGGRTIARLRPGEPVRGDDPSDAAAQSGTTGGTRPGGQNNQDTPLVPGRPGLRLRRRHARQHRHQQSRDRRRRYRLRDLRRRHHRQRQGGGHRPGQRPGGGQGRGGGGAAQARPDRRLRTWSRWGSW